MISYPHKVHTMATFTAHKVHTMCPPRGFFGRARSLFLILGVRRLQRTKRQLVVSVGSLHQMYCSYAPAKSAYFDSKKRILCPQ